MDPCEELTVPVEEIIDAGGAHLIPGFVDVHVHGGGGFDVMSGNSDDIDGMSRYHASKGTTSFLPTTVTHRRGVIEQAIVGIVAAMKKGIGGAEVLGIHLEGPFLNIKNCGAQNTEYIREADLEELNYYIKLSQGSIKLMTIAPEQEKAIPLIQSAVEQGITVSLGHSDATYEVVNQSILAGATHVTHLFNGMRALHHREPGLAGSALMRNELAVEVFTYGFIALITAISIANIFNTTATGISLRKREFAMLKSIGMTPKGFNKMMNYESAFYGIKSLLYGLPISIIVMYLIHMSLSNSFSYAFSLPWTSIAFVIVAVFVIVSSAMLYASSRVKKENIIDVLKQESITTA